MAELIIHQDKIPDNQELIKLCPFGAMEEKDGKVTISAACKMCRLCVRKGPKGAVEYVEDAVKPSVDKSEWKGIAVYVDHVDGKVHPVTLELLGKARELSKVTGHPVYALFMGNGIEAAAHELLHYNVDKVFVYDAPELARFQIEPYTAVFENFIQTVKPSSILVGATTVGRQLAPRVAARMKTGLTADCTILEMDENTDLSQIRPAFGGNIMAHSAVMMTDILKGVVTKGTAASMGWSGNIEAAGKTGTTNGSRDGWFCGMTPYYTMTVWVGYDQQKTLSSLYGGTYPAKIWKNAMEKMVEGLPAASFDTPETDNGRGEGTYLAGHPDAFEITTSGYTAANFRRDHLLSDEAAKLLESAKSGDSGRSSKELKEDASAKIEQIKSESIKERMQRIHKTGTAGKRYSAPAVVPETPAETVEDPAESSTTIVPAGPGSDIGPGHGPAQEPAVGPAAEIGQ